MKQSRIVMGLFALLIAFTISSCKDDDDPTSSKTKTELLTQNTWIYKTSSPSNATVNSVYSGSEYKFSSDGKYTGVLFAFPISGVWEFAQNESKVIIDKGEDFEATWTVKTLNESTLELTESTGALTLQYVKK